MKWNRSRVGVKISPMHVSGPFAANDETLPMAEYAIRELNGYRLSHLLLMGATNRLYRHAAGKFDGRRHVPSLPAYFPGNIDRQCSDGTARARQSPDCRGPGPISWRSAGPISPTPIWWNACAPAHRSHENRLGHRLCIPAPPGYADYPALQNRRPFEHAPTTHKGDYHVQNHTRNRTRRSFWKPSTRSSIRGTTRRPRNTGPIATSSTARISRRGRDGLFNLIRAVPATLRYESGLILAEGDYVIVHGRFSGNGRPAAWIAADVVRIEKRQARRTLGCAAGRSDAGAIRQRIADVW